MQAKTVMLFGKICEVIKSMASSILIHIPVSTGGSVAPRKFDTNTNAPEKYHQMALTHLFCQYCSDFTVTNNYAFEIEHSTQTNDP